MALGLLVLGFSVCMVIAALRYPGGTWCDSSAPGYQLLDSFFCDVLHQRGLNGSPNPGAPWARAALLLAGLGFLPFWLSLEQTMELFPRRALLVKSIGSISALAGIAVALAPSDRLPGLHQLAVLAASSFGVAAAIIACTARAVGSSARALRLLGWLALTTAATDAGLYLAQVLKPEPCAVALPALQKLAALLALAWMLGHAFLLVRSSRPAGRPSPR